VTKRQRIIFAAIFSALLASSNAPSAARAQSTNPSGNPVTTPQTTPMTPSEKANLDMVLNWWREVIQGRHVELSERYQAEDYIQHNPNVPTGRAGFVKFFSSLGPPINPIPATLSPSPVVQGAKGDFVWLVFEHLGRNPRDTTKTYRFNSIEVLRIQNGKVQEHWDSAKKEPGSAPFVPSTAPAPSTWNTGRLSDSERHNVKLTTEVLKDLLQYGHLELADTLVDPSYIQHNPNVPQGSAGLRSYMTGFHPPREQIKPEWKDAPVLTLANGPYVLMMFNEKEKDPAGKEYAWNHFDVLRIEDGRLKEHWDEETLVIP
jgi:predicted SnoaL-like aldol condensation-catalyzing enzyme